jgi:hypothetical protein
LAAGALLGLGEFCGGTEYGVLAFELNRLQKETSVDTTRAGITPCPHLCVLAKILPESGLKD